MRAIIVDDNKRYRDKLKVHIKQRLGFTSVNKGLRTVDYERATSYQIAMNVNESVRIEKEDLLVFINLNLSCADVSRQQQTGVEVLQHLRLSDSFVDQSSRQMTENLARDVHCVVYSFHTFEQVFRQRPESLILASEGTTFLRLPDDFAGLEAAKLIARRPDADSLPRYLRGSCFIPDNRHNQANWWGIKQLWDVHRVVVNAPNKRYPSTKIYENLQEPENQVAMCLYGHQAKDIKSVYGGLAEKIKGCRAEVSQRCPRVLHVDDNWENGWSKTFQNMMLSEKQVSELKKDSTATHFETQLLGGKPFFRSYKSFDEDAADIEMKVERIADRIKSLIADERDREPEVILLDLRLFSTQEEQQTDVKKLSGALLLEQLRADFMGVPVIMTTASNKAWSFEELTRLGADGYWIKEGLDGRNSPADSVRNYYRFLDLVCLATGDKYSFFRTFNRAVSDLKKESGHWWENHVWIMPDGSTVTTQADTSFIYKVLDETLLMLRTYLHDFEMEYGFSNADKKFWVGTIMRQAAITMEAAHKRQSSGLFERRSDWFGWRLYQLRNLATHVSHDSSGTDVKVDWADLVSFLKYLSCYLYFGPQNGFRKEMSLREMNALIPDYTDLLRTF